MTLMCKS